ncbi:MAG TPA: hypothetical protein VGP73_03415 [Thermoanaerobaculia bacterium]
MELLVRVSQDSVAQSLEVGVPVLIVGDLAGLTMHGAVELQNQPQLMAEKIGDVGTDRGLPAELEIQKAAVSEVGPEDLFGRREGLPQVLCTDQSVFVREAHAVLILLTEQSFG